MAASCFCKDGVGPSAGSGESCPCCTMNPRKETEVWNFLRFHKQFDLQQMPENKPNVFLFVSEKM